MIKQLTPKYKFICDRCGKEQVSNDGEGFCLNKVEFRDVSRFLNPTISVGDICEDCLKDFLELAENFFDEANKNKEVQGDE